MSRSGMDIDFGLAYLEDGLEPRNGLYPGDVLFFGLPQCRRARINSQQWRDMLAAAVREFDEKASRVPISCPVCGKVPTSGEMRTDSNLTPKYSEPNDGSGKPSGTLIGMERKRPVTTEINFRCECGCEGHMTYEHPAKGGAE